MLDNEEEYYDYYYYRYNHTYLTNDSITGFDFSDSLSTPPNSET